MNILAIDTSTADLNTAIKTDTFYQENCCKNLLGMHSEKIMPTIFELCKTADKELKDIDLFACTRGPGSFTGLRISMAALKGLSFGFSKPLVSVSTLETFARACALDVNGVAVTVLDAKKQRWYLAAFEIRDGEVTRLLADTDGIPEDLDKVLKDKKEIFVTGPDCEVFSEILKQHYSNKTIICDDWNKRSVTHALIELASAILNPTP